jgi:hypothetical protein
MATLNSAEILRRRVGDKPRMAIETYYGDGFNNMFQYSGNPIVTGCTSLGAIKPSAYVLAGNGWSGTASTFDYLQGTVTFSGTISALSAFQLVYTYATFSDQEIDQVTAAYGSIPDMQMDLIDTLMADSYKRMAWGSERGSTYDESKTMTNLMMMRSAVFASKTVETGPHGYFAEWAATQETNT